PRSGPRSWPAGGGRDDRADRAPVVRHQAAAGDRLIQRCWVVTGVPFYDRHERLREHVPEQSNELVPLARSTRITRTNLATLQLYVAVPRSRTGPWSNGRRRSCRRRKATVRACET